MFSEFTKFIAQPHRHAEHMDTRAAIHRHDPDYPRKKRDKKAKQDANKNDTTEISIDAAILFLKDVLSREQSTEKSTAEHAKEKLKAFSKPAAFHASHAYEHAAETSTPRQPNTENQGNNAISDLINRLRALKTQKIETLYIETDGDFLQSLSIAAERALTSA